MKTEYVYHVVTERPMELGQKLIFDQQHHNGVYHRVTAFKALLCGEPVEEKLVRLLQADMDKWSKVAYREMALEKIRKEYFPTYPSRMACLYTSRTLQEAQSLSLIHICFPAYSRHEYTRYPVCNSAFFSSFLILPSKTCNVYTFCRRRCR